MKKLYAFFRHNSGVCVSFALLPLILVYAYSCQSVVISGLDPTKKINRQSLVNEVDFFLAQAEAKFADLDRQDLVKGTIFNSVLDLAKGGSVNPAGILMVIGQILGFGAVIDNVRKRTHINTLKGGNVNAQKNQTLKETPAVKGQTSL